MVREMLLPRSLRRKIILGFSAIGSLIVGLAMLASVDSVLIEGKILRGEKVSELFDVALQIRRFEKNYLLYHERHDYLETLEQVSNALHLVRSEREAFLPLAGEGYIVHFEERLRAYRDLFEGYGRTHATQEVGAAADLQNQIRQAGKEIVAFAEKAVVAERDLLRASVVRQRHGLIWAIVVITLLAILVGHLMAGRVARTLRQIEESMRTVAGGSLRPIVLAGEDREVVSLNHAFNRMLKEIESRQRHLVHTEKLASLGTLLSGVAHELNNPLSNISTSCQILLEEGDAADAGFRRSMLSQIDNQTLRARAVVRSLLEFSGRREMIRKEQLLAPLVSEVISLVQGEIPSRIALEVDIPPALTVLVDKQRLQHVLLNLVKNAIEASGPEGRVRIIAARHSATGSGAGAMAARANCPAGRETVEIMVADDGAGIAPETLVRVFDPFFTTKGVGKGTGLGLFIVHEIVEEHGGCVTVESEPGRGSAFHVWLPAPAPQPGD